jgi:hypothetical protein
MPNQENKIDWTNVNNDSHGNPRIVCHYLEIADDYETALQIARKVGGKKFHNRQYGGGVIFQSYNPDTTEARLKQAIENHRASNQ